MRKNKKRSKKIYEVLTAVYFLGSIIAVPISLFYSAKTGSSSITGLIIGQMFLFAGIRILLEKEVAGWIPALVGFAIVIIWGYPHLAIFIDSLWGIKLHIDAEKIIPLLFSVAFIICPLIILLSDKNIEKEEKTTCTYLVNAKCVSDGTWRKYGKTRYAPIYEYYYKDKKYLARDMWQQNLLLFINMEDDIDITQEYEPNSRVIPERDLMINPNNPEEYYFILTEYEKKVKLFSCYLIGFFSIIGFLLLMFLIIRF